MCLMKRVSLKKQPPSASSTDVISKARSKPKVPDESSLEMSNSNTNSSHLSKESRLSSSSATSLTQIRDMLSDGPVIFQYKDLCKVTENFSSSNKVGASVFRGKLQKTEVAVVVDKRGGKASNNFVAEIKNLGSVHHANLVKLLGGCTNGDHVYLVYEYINGGNLRQYLHNTYNPAFSALPSWMSRIQVALEVSKGLEYLHHHTLVPTVHKYIKSSNILFDEERHVKIAYVGVAKIRGETGSEVKVTILPEAEIREVKEGELSGRKPHRNLQRSPSIKITGTHGYMAPEYVNGGLISPKLDVYAFGVILLELLSGKEAVSFQANLGTNYMRKTLLTEVIVSICADKDPKSRLRSWMDPLLRDRFPLECALKTAQLARSCVDPTPQLRPDMSKVSMTLLQIQMTSQIWNDKMNASKALLTSTMQAR